MKIFRKLFVVLLLVSVIFTSGCSLDFLKELPTKPANAEKPITENPVEATPTTAPTTAPTTPPTAVPTPEPTPTPTPTPVPTVAPTPKPVPPTTPSIKITKDPTDEPSVTDGREKTYFVAHAENYEQMSWEFMDANGGVMTAEDATNYYGVSISGYNEETLIIWNATWTINGWKVRAIFHNYTNGEVKYTAWAGITIVPAGIIITKDPYDETSVTEGQEQVTFVARAKNYEQMSWEFMDANGEIFTAEDAVKYRGQIIDGYNSEKLIIWRPNWTINGWKVRAVFYNFTIGETKRTAWASIALVENQYIPPAPPPPVQPDQPPVIIGGGDNPINQMTLYVIASGVLIRSTPGGGEYSGYKEAGQTVTVDAENGNWYHLVGGGYMSKDYLSTDRWDIWNHFVDKYGTGAIVDLSEQHAYFYYNGVLLGETDCVTGDAYSSPTPIGCYTVWSKREDFNMLDDPTYYTAYATFFNNGIAIHDADHWRSQYGGTIYQGNGSHGCVNTPCWFAEIVYYNSTNGTPVLVIP